MRIKNTIIVIAFLMVITLGATPLSTAATTQWFPTANATSEYTVSLLNYLQNGSVIESTTFDVYNSIAGIEVIPSTNKYLFSEPAFGSWALSANDTTLKLRYTYTEDSVTTWKRSKTLIIGTNETTFHECYFYRWYDSMGYLFNKINGTYDFVQKTNFFDTITTGSFVDYINKELKPGETLYPVGYSIITITSDHIIAHRAYGTTNTTIFASLNGRVQLKQMVASNIVTDTRGLKSAAIHYTLEDTTSSGIPSFPLILIILGFMVVTVVSIIRRTRKSAVI